LKETQNSIAKHIFVTGKIKFEVHSLLSYLICEFFPDLLGRTEGVRLFDCCIPSILERPHREKRNCNIIFLYRQFNEEEAIEVPEKEKSEDICCVLLPVSISTQHHHSVVVITYYILIIVI
jgi:hypothetical protein